MQHEISLTAFAALHKAILAIPESERLFAVRFLSSRMNMPLEEVSAEFYRQCSERLEAERLEAHRREKVQSEFFETMPDDKRAAIAKILGVSAMGAEGTTKQ